MHLLARCPRMAPVFSVVFGRRAAPHSEFASESMSAGTVEALWKLRPHCHPQAGLRRFVPAGVRALHLSSRVTEAASGDFANCCRSVTPLRLSRWPKGILRFMTLRGAPNILG